MDLLGKINGTRSVDPSIEDTSEVEGNTELPRVLMLGGFGRSGSTLLERCLAQCEGFTGMGEVLHLWERGLRDNELCGCNQPFDQCPYWRSIGHLAYGGWDKVHTEETISDRRTVVRNRFLPELMGQFAIGSRRAARTRLLEQLNKLYSAASLQSGSDILVDSSKHPAYSYLLRSARIDLRCVLVVRDARGVAFSWSKVVKRPETGERNEEMPRYSIFESMVNWTSYSLLFHALAIFRIPVLTVHYEQFMAEPTETIRRIAQFAGHTASAPLLPELKDKSVTLSAHHTVAGNPMRFKVGRVNLNLDEAWKIKMKRWDRIVATGLSAPLRAAYYLGNLFRR